MTNYDILKEYEAHKTPVPSYEEWVKLKKQLETAVNALKPYQCHKLVFKCADGTELEFEGSFKGSENINLEELNP